MDDNYLVGTPGADYLLPQLHKLLDGVSALLQGLLRSNVAETLLVDPVNLNLVLRSMDPARL